jgi:2,3-bisphosphoglycerate-dependent phosphoglycerate mutase
VFVGQLVLLRHGESLWNKENRFTGWVDVDLTDFGRAEALEAGLVLKKEGLKFSNSYTSLLTRAIRTHFLALESFGALWLPVQRSWRLNERHYGALQGLNKAEMAQKHGEEQVKIWRRSFSVRPPELSYDDPQHPRFDPRYGSLVGEKGVRLPSAESLADTIDRVIPFWNEELQPKLLQGENLLVVAHGNSIRALVKHLEGLTPEQILEVNIPTGVPLLYEVEAASQGSFRLGTKTYLGDPEKVAAKISQVANQGKAKA